MQDLCLAFKDEAESLLILYFDSKPNYQNIDVIGVIYEPIVSDPFIDHKEVVLTPLPSPNCGVNIRLLDDEDIEPLKPFIVEPKNPIRDWA
jgi:hypothetical protein